MNTFPHPGTSQLCGLCLEDDGRIMRSRVGMPAEVRLQQPFGAEGHGASGEGALEGEFSLCVTHPPRRHGMLQKMLLELRAGAEGLIAALVAAHVGSFIVMDPHVTLETAIGSEGFLTHLALEELLVSFPSNPP